MKQVGFGQILLGLLLAAFLLWLMFAVGGIQGGTKVTL